MKKNILPQDIKDPLVDVEIPLTVKATVRNKRLIKTIFKVALSASFILYLLSGTNLPEIGAALIRANFAPFFLAACLHFMGFALSAVRWRLLIRACGADATLKYLIASYFVSCFFSNLMPSTIGGDAYRAYDACRIGLRIPTSVSIILVDRFLGLSVLVLFAFIALMCSSVLSDSLPYLTTAVIVGLGGMVFMVWLIFFPPKWLQHLFADAKFRIGQKLHIVFQALFAFQGQRLVLFKSIGWSVVLQTTVVVEHYLIASALGIPIGLSAFFLITPVAIMITMLPISINGIGIREYAYVLFFGAFAIGKPEALAFVWAAFSLVVLQGLVGGVVYALRP